MQGPPLTPTSLARCPRSRCVRGSGDDGCEGRAQILVCMTPGVLMNDMQQFKSQRKRRFVDIPVVGLCLACTYLSAIKRSGIDAGVGTSRPRPARRPRTPWNKGDRHCNGRTLFSSLWQIDSNCLL